MTAKIINYEALENATLVKEPFPYLIVDNIIRPEVLDEVVKTFPKIEKRGSFPLNAIEHSGHFATFMQELQDEKLRDIIAKKFGMDLNDKPPMVTVRGQTTDRDGHIHTDSTDKLITVLIYMNPNWQDEGGRIRVLYNKHDLSPYAAEVAPEAGRCLIFKVTDNCWHGHTVFNGERRSLQLNYVTSDNARNKHLKRHGFSAFLKKLFSRKNEKNPTY